MENIQEKATILVVDDTPDNLALISGLLQGNYRVKVATNGVNALKIAGGDNPPELILLDVMMPEMDGYEVCRRLKAEPATREIPVIFLTARSDSEAERNGLNIGAVDYITKPISPPILMARIRTHLHLKATADFLRDKNEYLEQEVAKRTKEVRALQDVAILAMASLAETRDSETGYHIRRTQLYVDALARRLQRHPRFAPLLTDRLIEMFVKSAPLHDIGKVGIPDAILLKPGPLTPAEFTIMKTHTTIGRDAIVNAERQWGKQVAFLHYAKEQTYCHHEKWDGSGYPEGIAGEAIPLSARLMAVADVYDALVSPRIYKPMMMHEAAFSIIGAGSGSHFDPHIVDAFQEIHTRIRDIADQYADHNPHDTW